MNTSSVNIYIPSYGYTYTFTGVTAIRHSLSLRIATDEDVSQDTSFVHGAKNQPDRLTLSVVESATVGAQRPAQMAAALAAVKQTRALCRVTTSLRTYENMLLSECTILQDEESPFGWSGTLTFTEADFSASASASADTIKTNTNSSIITNTGASGAATVSGAPSATSPLRTLLLQAGISL